MFILVKIHGVFGVPDEIHQGGGKELVIGIDAVEGHGERFDVGERLHAVNFLSRGKAADAGFKKAHGRVGKALEGSFGN